MSFSLRASTSTEAKYPFACNAPAASCVSERMRLICFCKFYCALKLLFLSLSQKNTVFHSCFQFRFYFSLQHNSVRYDFRGHSNQDELKFLYLEAHLQKNVLSRRAMNKFLFQH